MENPDDSALVYTAQYYVPREQRPARFSLISSESAKGSLIVSSTQVYSKYSSSDYKSNRHWSTLQCYTADEHNVATAKMNWGRVFLSKHILQNTKLSPLECTSKNNRIMPKFLNIQFNIKLKFNINIFSCILQNILLPLCVYSDPSTHAGVKLNVAFGINESEPI